MWFLFFKKSSLDPKNLSSRPVSNLPFWAKYAVAPQHHGFLDEPHYLDSFQSSFRPGFGTEGGDGLRTRSASLVSLTLLRLSIPSATVSFWCTWLSKDCVVQGGTGFVLSFLINSRRWFWETTAWHFGHWPMVFCRVPSFFLPSSLTSTWTHCIWCHQYADATQLYIKFQGDSRCSELVLGWDYGLHGGK